jgi:hypothetical protein
MKLADIDIDDLILATETIQQEWISAPKEERRQAAEAEVVTMCILHALGGVFRHIKNKEGRERLAQLEEEGRHIDGAKLRADLERAMKELAEREKEKLVKQALLQGSSQPPVS